MKKKSLQAICLLLGSLFAICIGSDLHPIRHRRANQKKSYSFLDKTIPNSEEELISGETLTLPYDTNKEYEISPDSFTKYRRTELKSVANLFRKSSSIKTDNNKKRDSPTPQAEETPHKKPNKTRSEKTGVSIKFSGKHFQRINMDNYPNSKIPLRGYLDALQYYKPNKTSLWPLTYSPGTVEATLNNTSINVTSEAGNGVFLPCRVGHLGDTQISWIRRRDWHVITSGSNLYSQDKRFSVLHDTSSHDWTLQIKMATKKDQGTYECQVSTDTGIISLFVNLSIVVPAARLIRGQGQYHVNKGSSISLTCIIENNLMIPPHVLWHHNGEQLNFLRDRPHLYIRMEKPVPKYKIKYSFVSGKNFSKENSIYDVKSHLRIDSASERHSGNYSCSTPNAKPASILVFITEGDKTAAVHRIDSGATTLLSSVSTSSYISLLTILLFILERR